MVHMWETAVTGKIGKQSFQFERKIGEVRKKLILHISSVIVKYHTGYLGTPEPELVVLHH